MDWLDSLESGASDFWNSFDVNKFLTTATQAYAVYRKANQAPPVAPGTIRTLPDGSRVRVNADGSMTVVTAVGQSQTIGARTLLPGVPDLVTYAGGAVLLVLALRAFSRK